MPAEVRLNTSNHIVEVHLSGKLEKSDYQRFVPELEQLIQNEGKLRVMIVMKDFHGWTVSALWEEMKFDLKHFSDIERVAMVGDKKWEKGMSVFCKPFTTAKVRYFDLGEQDTAKTWLTENQPSRAGR